MPPTPLAADILKKEQRIAEIIGPLSISALSGWLAPTGAQLQPRELFHQRGAIGITVPLRQIAAV